MQALKQIAFKRNAEASFLAYYHESRTYLSLAKDAPEPRPVHPAAAAPSLRYLKLAGFTTARFERRAA